MAKKKAPTIYVVSDGQGTTANLVVEAAVLQFEEHDTRRVTRKTVRTPARVKKVVEEAANESAVIFFTLVGEDTRRVMREESARHSVPTVDILGPAFRALNDLLHAPRGAKPGLRYSADQERIERQIAIEFTLTHDDGLRPHELDRADVVLVGVSRASKSSTCFYLAYAGIKAANVPLIEGVDLPAKLENIASEKVIGLRINTHRLMMIRGARAEGLGLADSYQDKQAVAREVTFANRLMEERGWRSFDTSYMAIEEIAKEVLRIRDLKGKRPW